ncbi:MAG: hypothetical protein R2715_01090 [Ilumatobacteraceae bacterium]
MTTREQVGAGRDAGWSGPPGSTRLDGVLLSGTYRTADGRGWFAADGTEAVTSSEPSEPIVLLDDQPCLGVTGDHVVVRRLECTGSSAPVPRTSITSVVVHD